MKKLETSKIAAGSKAPISDRSLAHLQEADRETIESTMKALIDESLDNSSAYPNVVILHGAKLTDNGSDIDINSGAVYYQGEIYRVDAQTATPITNSPAWKIATTYRTGDPVEFSDGVDKDFHAIEKMEIVDSSEGSTIENYSSSSRFLDVNAAQVETSIFDGVITENGGNIGINNASPAEALDIVGSIQLTGSINGNSNNINIDDGSGDFTASVLNEIRFNFDSDNNGTGEFNLLSGGSSVFTVANTGAVSITNDVNMNNNSLNGVDNVQLTGSINDNSNNINIDDGSGDFTASVLNEIRFNFDSDNNGTGEFSLLSGGSSVFTVDNAGAVSITGDVKLGDSHRIIDSGASLDIESDGSIILDYDQVDDGSGLFIIRSGGAEIFTITNDGKIEIRGQEKIEFGASNNFISRSSGDIIISTTNSPILDYDTDNSGVGAFIIRRNGIDQARFDNSGNLNLIGNSIEDVSTVSNTGNIILDYDSDDNGGGEFFIRQGGSNAITVDNSNNIDFHGRQVVNTGRLLPDIDAGRDVGSSSSRYNIGYFESGTTTSSDRRLKTNIKPSKGLDIINKLTPVEYNWKKDPEGKISLGFIAQDVLSVLGEDFKVVETTNPESYNLFYDELIAPLVKAVQELSARLDKLEN